MDVPIEDYLAISETKARYCRCLDTKDWAGFADVFMPDLVLDTRPSGGSEMHGRETAVAMVRASLDGCPTVHQVHNPEMKAVDADTVDVIWPMQDRVVWSAEKAAKIGNAGLTGFGHYHETYGRCDDGRWRIARQTLTRLHMDFHPS